MKRLAPVVLLAFAGCVGLNGEVQKSLEKLDKVADRTAQAERTLSASTDAFIRRSTDVVSAVTTCADEVAGILSAARSEYEGGLEERKAVLANVASVSSSVARILDTSDRSLAAFASRDAERHTFAVKVEGEVAETLGHVASVTSSLDALLAREVRKAPDAERLGGGIGLALLALLVAFSAVGLAIFVHLVRREVRESLSEHGRRLDAAIARAFPQGGQ